MFRIPGCSPCSVWLSCCCLCSKCYFDAAATVVTAATNVAVSEKVT